MNKTKGKENKQKESLLDNLIEATSHI